MPETRASLKGIFGGQLKINRFYNLNLLSRGD
jgi:hypothetical protein